MEKDVVATLGRIPLFEGTPAQEMSIDFEYSGNNDPVWNLGGLSVETEFDHEQDRIFLNAYFDGQPPAFDLGRMVLYKASPGPLPAIDGDGGVFLSCGGCATRGWVSRSLVIVQVQAKGTD